jgi:hypothetical protein
MSGASSNAASASASSAGIQKPVLPMSAIADFNKSTLKKTETKVRHLDFGAAKVEDKGWRTFSDAIVFGTEKEEGEDVAFSARYVVCGVRRLVVWCCLVEERADLKGFCECLCVAAGGHSGYRIGAQRPAVQ